MSDVRQRTAQVGVRLLPEEKADVERIAVTLGVSPSEVLRRAFHGDPAAQWKGSTMTEPKLSPEHQRAVDGMAFESALLYEHGITVPLGEGVKLLDWLAAHNAKIADDAWNLAHSQMCKIGNEFCSSHKPPYRAATIRGEKS